MVLNIERVCNSLDGQWTEMKQVTETDKRHLLWDGCRDRGEAWCQTVAHSATDTDGEETARWREEVEQWWDETDIPHVLMTLQPQTYTYFLKCEWVHIYNNYHHVDIIKRIRWNHIMNHEHVDFHVNPNKVCSDMCHCLMVIYCPNALKPLSLICSVSNKTSSTTKNKEWGVTTLPSV